MSLLDHARNIVLRPKVEWYTISAEPSSAGALYGGYVGPLALIGPIATFIGLTVIGIGIPFIGTYRVPFVSGLAQAALSFVLALVGVFVLALLIDALAPTFSGTKNPQQALKVAAYAGTPAYLAGILGIFPALAILQVLAAFYALYLLYLGLPILMNAPKEKALPYTATIVACGLVVGIALGAVAATLRFSPFGFGGVPAAYTGHEAGSGAAATVVQGAIAAAAAQVAAQESTRASKRATTSASTGANDAVADNTGTAAAAVGALGALVGGGKSVDVIGYRELKTLLPETLPGMTRKTATAQTTTVAGITGSTATGTYENAQSGRISVAISDMGNASGLMALGGLAMSATETESDTGFEKNVTIDGRKLRERFTKDGSKTELTAMVADRFMIEVDSSGVDPAAAIDALGKLDLPKLESFKSARAPK